jgi:hypothetical protein
VTETTDTSPPAGARLPAARVARWKFLALAALFVLPIAAATLLYYAGWRPPATVNAGELVVPARPVDAGALVDLAGQPLAQPLLKGKWTMLYFGPSDCGTGCDRMLYTMRQVHSAQGREAHRIARLFVATDTGALDWLRFTVRNYPDLRVAVGPAEAVRGLARQFALPAGSPLDGLGRLYIVDPLGNFMMSYPADADPSAMRKDFVRLLKVSQIG